MFSNETKWKTIIIYLYENYFKRKKLIKRNGEREVKKKKKKKVTKL
jgi:hypothetical protein